MSAAKGQARELACFGARGDGKTVAALWAMIMHASEHTRAGFPLPVAWLGVRDTFANHVLSTHKSLAATHWGGRWQLSEQGHLARYSVEGAPLVALSLVGVDSPRDAERLRTECHGLWFDEAAPAMDLSHGIVEQHWNLALSSQRLPTHARVALLTTNYPDEEHWSWRRFVADPEPQTLAYRIPPGERADPDYRAEMMRIYANRPDLLRRLVEGKPGMLVQGEQVAHGFDRAMHVGECSRVESDVALWIGQDGGLTPTTVIGQRVGGEVRILAALSSEHDGMRGHLRALVLPWLGEHAPWILEGRRHDALHVRYDPALDTDEQADIESNPLRVMRALLVGTYLPGPVTWDGRRDPLLAALNSRHPRLIVDRSCRGLIRALDGAWHYPIGANGKISRDLPKKPDHPHEDYGDALCYLIAGLAPTKARAVNVQRPKIKNSWSVLDYDHQVPIP